MTTPVGLEPRGGDATPDAAAAASSPGQVQGRSLGQIARMRFRRDRVAVASAVFVVFLLLVALFAPLIIGLLGDPPDQRNIELIDPNTGAPYGTLGGISAAHPLGVEPVSGRDVLARILDGARVSLLVALSATALSVLIGTVLGVLAGYLGGWVDTVVSRVMDVLLAFPIILFAIALAAVVPDQAFGLTTLQLKVLALVVIIGLFNWPYIGRIIRGQVISLRQKEFVDAARSLGAGPGRIMFKEILPNLVAPILIYSTLIIPTNILFEAALSFLGVGVPPPQASWGGMLSEASQGLFAIDPMFMIVPGMAIFLTVMAFNLLGDGLRDALDPRGGR